MATGLAAVVRGRSPAGRVAHRLMMWRLEGRPRQTVLSAPVGPPLPPQAPVSLLQAPRARRQRSVARVEWLGRRHSTPRQARRPMRRGGAQSMIAEVPGELPVAARRWSASWFYTSFPSSRSPVGFTSTLEQTKTVSFSASCADCALPVKQALFRAAGQHHSMCGATVCIG